MDKKSQKETASIIWNCWEFGKTIPNLPDINRPKDRTEAYLVQSELVKISGQRSIGWKIAATSIAGQNHIGVDGPIAGRLLSPRVITDTTTVSIKNNSMQVIEAEFAFQLNQDFPVRENPYQIEEVLEAIDVVRPSLEIPDSRYQNFEQVGAEQLIVDNACADWLVIGKEQKLPWSEIQFSEERVYVYKNEELYEIGIGRNVLDDPIKALTWLVNEIRMYGNGVKAGELITTGTCIAPMAIRRGDNVKADFGQCGVIDIMID